MAYIYLDESGDLGFNFRRKKTSQYFVVACIITTRKDDLEKIVKKVFTGFSKKEVMNHNGVLHAYKESPKTRQKLLRLIHEKGVVDIIVIYLDKKKVYTKLQDKKHVLYNYVTNILLDRVCTRKLVPLNEKISIIASRRETSRFLNMNFSSYLKEQARKNHKREIEINIASPSAEKGLQVVDMISWSVFRKYEHGDSMYYDLIKEDIIEENPLFS